MGITSGCSRSPAPAGTTAAPGSQVASQIGLGQLSGHTYTHDHFKLAVTIPEEWYIQKKSEADQLAQAGAAAMKQDAHGQAVAQAAQQRTLTLLSAFQHPPGTPVEFNPSFIVLAENVSFLPGLKLGEDYLKLMGKSMSALTLKHEIEPIETGFKIGSHPAARLRIHLHVADKLVEQESYAASAIRRLFYRCNALVRRGRAAGCSPIDSGGSAEGGLSGFVPSNKSLTRIRQAFDDTDAARHIEDLIRSFAGIEFAVVSPDVIDVFFGRLIAALYSHAANSCGSAVGCP